MRTGWQYETKLTLYDLEKELAKLRDSFLTGIDSEHTCGCSQQRPPVRNAHKAVSNGVRFIEVPLCIPCRSGADPEVVCWVRTNYPLASTILNILTALIRVVCRVASVPPPRHQHPRCFHYS